MDAWPALLVAALAITLGLLVLLKTDAALSVLGDNFRTPSGRAGGEAVRRPVRFFGYCALGLGAVSIAVFFVAS
jgi:hypothetical protein